MNMGRNPECRIRVQRNLLAAMQQSVLPLVPGLGRVRPISKLALTALVALITVHVASAGDLPTRETQYWDPLDVANDAAGEQGTSFANGEIVSIFNGNLQVHHSSGRTYLIDNGGFFTLDRTYNSKHVVKDLVVTSSGTIHSSIRGQSWVGLGWTSHLGRVFELPKYSSGSGKYSSRVTYFELSSGTLVRLRPEKKRANPDMKLEFFPACPNYQAPSCCTSNPPKCEESPLCENPPNTCPSSRPPVDPAHYVATFPDGTQYRLEEIVPAVVDNDTGWIDNYDTAGFYTTSITDVFGNTIHVQYAGSGASHPEAITRIWANEFPAEGVADLRMDLWTAADAPSLCPVSAVGMLRRVRAAAPGGKSTFYDFYYTEKPLTDGIHGTRNFALLQRVTVTGSDGTNGGTTMYGYEVGLSEGAGTADFGPLLDRITYPIGAVVEYRYKSSISGRRAATNSDRTNAGISRRVEYPDGLGANDGSGMNRARWKWDRLTQTAFCEQPLVGFTNFTKLTDPHGNVTEVNFFGHPCGDNSDSFGSPGTIDTVKTFASDGTSLLRRVSWTYHTKHASDGEQILLKKETERVTYFDDTGACFGDSNGDGIPRQMLIRNSDFTNWRLPKKTEIRNALVGEDHSHGYLPRRSGAWISHESQTNYEDDTTAPACRNDANIHGAYDKTTITEGEWQSVIPVTFDCHGKKSSITLRDDWGGTDQLGDDIVSTTIFDSKGNGGHIAWTGGQSYGSGPAPNSYSADYTFSSGLRSKVRFQDSPFDTENLTIDPTGAITGSTNSTGLLTAYAFDDLGRTTKVDPPGADEFPQWFTYVGLNKVRRILSATAASSFDPLSLTQQYSETTVDSMGRVVEERESRSGGKLAVRVTKYDDVGRVVFNSNWLDNDSYPGQTLTPWTVDRDGDGSIDFTIANVPTTADGRANGVTYFYGHPTDQSGNPLKTSQDPLGKFTRVELPDGTAAETEICGIHKRISQFIDANRDGTADTGTPTAAVSKYYYDGLGRLVLVDSPPGTADAEYTYDGQSSLIKVNLLSQLPANPFETWKQGPLPDGQSRNFTYDALGRVKSSAEPESGGITETVDAYDSLGNKLLWKDALAVVRGYYYRNYYDSLSRLQRVERVRGTPTSPVEADVPRVLDSLLPTGAFGTWKAGALATDTFNDADPSPYWHAVSLGSLPCVTPPPGVASSAQVYYFGSSCGYAGAPSGAQAVRSALLAGVTRDDVLSLLYWRQVREGSGGQDKFTVYVVADSGSPTNMANRRIAFSIGMQQPSFPRWIRTPEVHPGDLFTSAEWPEGATKSIYILIVFEKGDQASTIGAGVAVADIFAGRRGKELIARYGYDERNCDLGLVHSDACIEGSEAVDRALGRLTSTYSYSGNRVTGWRKFVYRGLNGRVSAEERAVDLTGTAREAVGSDWEKWISRTIYDGAALVVDVVAPYQPGIDPVRRYRSAYKNGYLDGVTDAQSGIEFLTPNRPVAPAVEYDISGAISAVRAVNHTRVSNSLDSVKRLSSVTVFGPQDGGSSEIIHWNTGTYAYDAQSDILAIGNQRFSYDGSGRLTHAEILPQTQDPNGTTKEILDYQYDVYGNLLSQNRSAGAANSQWGLTFTHHFDLSNSGVVTNRHTDSEFSYDPTGRTTKSPGKIGQATTLIWDDQGNLAAFEEGTPQSGASPTEVYFYDSDGIRRMRWQIGRTAVPRLELRTTTGGLQSEYDLLPTSVHPKLVRDYVGGVGELSIERRAVTTFSTLDTSSPVLSNGQLNLVSAPGGGSYAIEIETPSGFTNYIAGVAADSAGHMAVASTETKADETNWVRVRKENSADSDYSPPITLVRDSTTNASAANQVQAVAVSRTGNNITVRWSLFANNNKNFKLYFHKGDASGNVLLTPTGLSASLRELTLATQALSSPCGSFYLTQYVSGGTETGPSLGASLGSAMPGSAGRVDPCGGGGSPPPGGSSPSTTFVDTYLYRDQVGNLRVVTDEWGQKTSSLDFYPFGLEVSLPGHTMSTESVEKFTGQSRDAESGLDYFVARYKPTTFANFLSPDSGADSSRLSTLSWNRYAYVRGNPISNSDPSGNTTVEICIIGCDSRITDVGSIWGPRNWLGIGTGAGNAANQVAGWSGPIWGLDGSPLKTSPPRRKYIWYDGGPGWTFGPDPSGLIRIKLQDWWYSADEWAGSFLEWYKKYFGMSDEARSKLEDALAHPENAVPSNPLLDMTDQIVKETPDAAVVGLAVMGGGLNGAGAEAETTFTSGIGRSLDDPSSLRGASVREVEALADAKYLQEGWTKKPLSDGNGIRYFDGKGNSFQINQGYSGAGGIHGGPYVKVTQGSQVVRIPLEGNPGL